MRHGAVSQSKTWTTSSRNGKCDSNYLSSQFQPSHSTKMGRQQRRSVRLNEVVLLCFMVCYVLGPASAIQVSSPAEVHAVKGDAVTLSCIFSSTSRATSKMSVDWAYRPQSGGPPHTFFHFSSLAFPPTDGQFKGRVNWVGSPARGEASIQLINATLTDNGTYTCSVRNPPDVHGSPTSQTVLTVTPKVVAVRFSDVAVLFALVLLPSAVISLVLMGRMFCTLKEGRSQAQSYRSPIEVTDREEHGGFKQISPKEKNMTCCDLYMLDSDYEDYYIHKEEPKDEVMVESQC